MHGSVWDGAFDSYAEALGQGRDKRTLRDYVSRFLGYGRPDFDRVATGAAQRVTLLGFGSLGDGEAAEFILPLPPCLSGINLRRRVTITLAWFSPINNRRQEYRVAHLWFSAVNDFVGERTCANHHAVQRGTVQHEVFEGRKAVDFQDGDHLLVKVNCRNDAGDILQPVPFGLAATLEVEEEVLLPIPIYEEVRQRIAVRVQPAVDEV